MLYTQPRRNFTESIIKGRNVVVNKEAMNETMNETMKYVSEMQEKTKKIEKMSSIQRKRHQRQFATLHFLMYGIKKFLGDSFFEDSTKKRVITIVYEPKTKDAARHFRNQIHILFENNPDINVKLISKDDHNKIYDSDLISNNEYIIYIGDFNESKLVYDHIFYWEFDRFGFKYGWIGRKAAISFYKKPSSEEYREMVTIAETEFIKAKYKIDMLKKMEGSLWDELSTPQKIAIIGGGVILVLLGAGGIAAAIADNKAKSEAKRVLDSRNDHKTDIPKTNEDVVIINETAIPKIDVDYAEPYEDDFYEFDMYEEENPVIDELDELTDMQLFIYSDYIDDWLERDEYLKDMAIEDYADLRDFADYAGIDFDMAVYWKLPKGYI